MSKAARRKSRPFRAGTLHAATSRAARTPVSRPDSADWARRRVTVMGLGRHGGGVGAARYLASRGALVTISDQAPRAALADSLAQLRDVPIKAVHLDGHDPADFRDAEYVVVNPAVHLDHVCLRIARDSGAVLTSESELFLRACPAAIIGVTGSNGKSTTCSMLQAILTAAGRRTWLGGNIGRSLLGEVDTMTADDWVVLELSSFQLAHLGDAAPLPRFAVVTNCTSNHLDWHGDMASYVQAKQRIVSRQEPDSVAVLNALDAEVAGWDASVAGRALWAWELERIPPLAVPGAHNRQNAACASAASSAAGVDESVICRALADFKGLEHRLVLVAEVDGRRFYNDSKSTTPAATLAALDAIEGPVWLLAGGLAKGVALDGLAHAIVERARGAGLFGVAREMIRSLVQSERADFPVHSTARLADALVWCWRRSRPGDAILLSPTCASYDQFRDFEERGETFCQLVRELPSSCKD